MHAIMAYRFFTISIRDEGPAAADLNGFLRSRRVLSVDRRWVDQGSESFWSFCVDYLESSGEATGGAPPGRNGTNRGKVDYREVLSPEDFAVFARLRQARKEIAQADAVPVYTIFTNEQLAQMVQARATTKAALWGLLVSVLISTKKELTPIIRRYPKQGICPQKSRGIRSEILI
jgi:hypothetical protein